MRFTGKSLLGAMIILAAVSICTGKLLASKNPTVIMKVGVGVADITPKWPVRLSSYNRPPTTASYQPIKVKAMALDDGRQVTLIVTADVVYFCPEINREIYARLARFRLAPHQVVLNASHSHSAPALCWFDVVQSCEIDANYQRYFADQVARAVETAVRDRKVAILETAESQCDVCINKRLGALMEPNPQGPVDHRVRLLVAKDAKSSALRAIFYLYGCHTSDLQANAFGGDFFGLASEYVETALPGVVALSAQGMAGEVRVDHRDRSGKDFYWSDTLDHLDFTRGLGKRLGDSVLSALQKPGKPVGGKIRSVMQQIELPLDLPASRGRAEEAAKSSDVWVARWGRHLLAEFASGKPLPRTVPYVIQVVQIGEDFNLVALDGEVFTRIGQQIEAALAPTRTFVLGYSNNVAGYIPTANEIPIGGYEIGVYYWWLIPAPFAPEVENTVIRGAVGLALQKP